MWPLINFNPFTEPLPPMLASPSIRDVKLPAFWRHASQEWFVNAEITFETLHVFLDDSKTDFVLRSLDHDTIQVIADLLRNGGRYAEIKERLITVFTFSSKVLCMANYLLATNPFPDMAQQAPINLQPLTNIYQLIQPSSYSFNNNMDETLRYATPATTETTAWTNINPLVTNGYNNHNNAVQPANIQNHRAPQRHSQYRHFLMTRRQMSGFCHYHSRYGRNAKKCRNPCSYHASMEV